MIDVQEFCRKFYDACEVSILKTEFISEKGTAEVRYYANGDGDPGEPAYTETYADLIISGSTDGEKEKELINTLREKTEYFSHMDFERLFGESIVEIVSNYEQIPSQIEEIDMYVKDINVRKGMLSIRLQITIQGEYE